MKVQVGDQAVRFDQLVALREAARTLSKLIERVGADEGPIVILKHGKPVAMLVKVPDD
jgi:prevent-host-death family protein